LSNLFLDDLDQELERRGHRFVRYADDCNIYVRSERAGLRVMKSLKTFLIRKLKLKVNEEKSGVGKASERKFLSFRFTAGKELKRGIAPEALWRFRKRIRERTRRTRGVSLEQMVRELTPYLLGWRNYFGFCQTPSALQHLDSWMRRRLRCVVCVWKQWKRGKTRFAELIRRDVGKDRAAKTAGSARGPWRISRSPALSFALPTSFFDSIGLPQLAARMTP
jgi:RNA-directed DNA polymerase